MCIFCANLSIVSYFEIFIMIHINVRDYKKDINPQIVPMCYFRSRNLFLVVLRLSPSHCLLLLFCCGSICVMIWCFLCALLYIQLLICVQIQ